MEGTEDALRRAEPPNSHLGSVFGADPRAFGRGPPFCLRRGLSNRKEDEQGSE